MVVRGVGTDGKGKTVTVLSSHDLRAFAASLGRREGGIDESLAFVDCPSLTRSIGQVGQDLPQRLTTTSLLETSVNRKADHRYREYYEAEKAFIPLIRGYGNRFDEEVKLLSIRSREAGMRRDEVARLVRANQ